MWMKEEQVRFPCVPGSCNAYTLLLQLSSTADDTARKAVAPPRSAGTWQLDLTQARQLCLFWRLAEGVRPRPSLNDCWGKGGTRLGPCQPAKNHLTLGSCWG